MTFDKEELLKYTEVVFFSGIEWEKNPKNRLYSTTDKFIEHMVELILEHSKGDS